jgi:ferredoxin/flavodoxin
MALHIRKALIVYCSPSGNTEHVAQVMKRRIASLETPVTVIDLGEDPDVPFIISQLLDAKDNTCLYIGTPVYASQPVPPVIEFISLLPAAENGYSVPFVTWGGVTSGMALYGMAKALQEKGYPVLGGAKILAKHSMMWASNAPLGGGHPDERDDRMVEELMERVHAKLKTGRPASLPLSALAYQPKEIHAQIEGGSFEAAKASFPPKQLVKERCNRCGICAARCPVEAINLSPYPDFGPACIGCYNCVRLCPEEAIAVDMSIAFAHSRAIAKQLNEQPGTRIFV